MKPKLYLKPTRPLALEAAIIAACARGRTTKLELGIFVYRTFSWAARTEIYATLERMISAGRILEVNEPGRTLPLYELPPAGHATHAPAPSPATA